MLIKEWSASVHKCPNVSGLYDKILEGDRSIYETSMEIPTYGAVPTLPLSEFSSFTPAGLQDLFDEQLSFIKNAARTYFDYGLLSKASMDSTMLFYKQYYVHNDIFIFNKSELYTFVSREYSASNTHLIDRKKEVNKNFLVQEISVDAIRAITGYSWSPFIKHLGDNAEVSWQRQLIEYAHDIEHVKEIIVDGSRQMGKSKTTAEILVESSFMPNFHQLVCAPDQNGTNLIKNYIDEYISGFDESLFITKSKDRYILNTFSGSRIHFMTLNKEGVKILGYTLSRIIIDEAQLISIPTVLGPLKPTLTTTDGQIICIGTAIADTSSYMYSSLMEMKRGYNPYGKYITVSADNNPFITPSVRKEIETALNNPMKRDEYMRQYYNQWGGGGNKLFSPDIIDEYDSDGKLGTVVIANDPARKHDKSAFSVLFIYEGSIICLESSEVPESHKGDWTMQRKYMEGIRSKYSKYGRIVTCMDGTGVGDGVVALFENGGYKINYVLKYTSGDKANIAKDEIRTIRIGKSLLINNALDLMTEGVFKVLKGKTDGLIDEMNFAESDFDKMGRVMMKSTYFDDEINAMLIGLYICTRFQFHLQSKSLNEANNSKGFAEEIRKAYPHTAKKSSSMGGGYTF